LNVCNSTLTRELIVEGKVKMRKKAIVIGLGEIGKPISELISGTCEVVGIDVAPIEKPVGNVDIMHVCYPFEIPDFIGETARYIEKFKPGLTIIESTVGVGTTRRIEERTGSDVVHSPVRGKHARMLNELRGYTKFIGATKDTAAKRAAEHFEMAGVKTKIVSSPEASELAKLTETTYFGLLIAFAQDVERYCDASGADYNEIASFYEEINYLPHVKFFSGVIGGHCVMPNIEILSQFQKSVMLDAIKSSNRLKIDRDRKNKSGDSSSPIVQKSEKAIV
jgi:UDP-N-acetyl-D-mannosaminuronate dehydrogenase